MNVRRLHGDDGAILIIAIAVVTAVALVVGTVLTQGDGSVRATVALRQVAGTTYAADAAAQVAINNLRIGYNSGDAEPAAWMFNNATGTGCFGYNADGSREDDLELPGFYPGSKSSGQGFTSALVECRAEVATGAQGSAVPITNANKPGNAILTLGTGGENGFTFKANGGGGAFRVRGGVWSNSTIVRDNNGDLESTESIRAHSGCSPPTAMKAPVVDCGATTLPDPNYPSEFDLAGATTPPPLRTPPSSCGSGTVTLLPGYYDDATKLNALTPNGGSNCFIHLAPGTYYLDFHNKSGNVSYGIEGGAEHVWNVNSGTIVGGTLDPTDTTVPGRCVNPIEDASAQGVQVVFGGDSRMIVDKGAALELCASYRAERPPIALYGQKTGTAAATVVPPANALTTTATPVVTPAGRFAGATVANLKAADGDQTTNANLAVWARDTAGPTAAQDGSITMTGFAPSTPLPEGTILTGARLKVTHMSDGNANAFTLTPTTGSGLSPYTLPARTALGTEDVDLTARTGWGAFQKSVHDNGFTGATLKFDASLQKLKTSRLDAARLELTYYLPSFRAQTTTAVPGNTVATPGGAPVLKALGQDTLVYVQGTTYTPLASIDLALNNIAESVFRFGVIARSLHIFETASFTYPGAVIELPDNSPGYGFNGTTAQLTVHLCPGQPTCSASSGELALTSRVQLWDPTGTPVQNRRQVTVLSWSHRR